MARIIPFPTLRSACVREELSLREVLISKGIEPTGDERRRKRRERMNERLASSRSLQTREACSSHDRNAGTVDAINVSAVGDPDNQS